MINKSKKLRKNRESVKNIEQKSSNDGISGWGFVSGLVIGYIIATLIGLLNLTLLVVGLTLYIIGFTALIKNGLEGGKKFIWSFAAGALGLIPGLIILWLWRSWREKGPIHSLLVYVFSLTMIWGIVIILALLSVAA